MAQLAEWPAVVTCGRSVAEAREMLLDAAREMVASYRPTSAVDGHTGWCFRPWFAVLMGV
jgi:hypothetical protein